jgi:hypothetical protein
LGTSVLKVTAPGTTPGGNNKRVIKALSKEAPYLVVQTPTKKKATGEEVKMESTA